MTEPIRMNISIDTTKMAQAVEQFQAAVAQRLGSEEVQRQVQQALHAFVSASESFRSVVEQSVEQPEVDSAPLNIPSSVIGAIAVRYELPIEEARERFERLTRSRDGDWQTCFRKVMRGQVPEDWGIDRLVDLERISRHLRGAWEPGTLRRSLPAPQGFTVRSQYRWNDSYLSYPPLLPNCRSYAVGIDLAREVCPTPKVCNGCQHYHGQTYGGNWLCCGMHPHGCESDFCPDWEGGESTSTPASESPF